MKRTVTPVPLLLLGAYTLSAQVVLFRELFVLFSGNELYIGIVFSSWLLWVSCGSAFLGRATERAGGWSIETGLACASILLVLSVAAIRIVAAGAVSLPGEIVTPGRAMLVSLTATAPCALLSGHLFGLSSRLLLHEQRQAYRAGGIVYAWEAWGSGLAGLVLGLFLLDRLGTVMSALLIAALSVSALIRRPSRSGGGFPRALLAALPLIALALIHPLVARMDLALESSRLPGYSIVAFADSPYGRIDAVRREDQAILFINNMPALISPDPAAAEEQIHIALASHPAPRSVLILGSAAGDLSAELAKYRLERVTAVELDARARALAETLGVGNTASVTVHIGDAREYLANDGPRYDVVILAAGEPVSLQGNRNFTTECFSAIKARLAPGGILGIALPGSENLMLRAQEQVHACVYATLARVFTSVAFLPGATAHFIAGDDVAAASLPRLIPARLRERGIAVSYLQPAALAFRFSDTRMMAAESVARPSFPVVVNDDFGFSCYAYTVISWYSKIGYPSALHAIGLIGRRRELFLIFLAMLAALYGGAVLACRRDPARRIAVPSILIAGFSGMAGGIALLIAFQIVCGMLYQWVAVLTGVFMVGAGGGGFILSRRRFKTGLAPVHVSLLTLFLLFAAVLSIHQRHPLSLVSAKLLFLGLETALGFATGAAFVGACGQLGEGEGVVPLIYAVDLLGGLLGAALFAGVMLPLLGLPLSAALLAGANGVACAVIGFIRR